MSFTEQLKFTLDRSFTE